MPGFGHLPELAVVLVIALIVFGPSRLPEVTGAIGKGLREFRRATGEIEDAVMSQSQPSAPEDNFPHIPPSGEESDAAPVTTVDTLAMRREQRQRAREAADSAQRAAITSEIAGGDKTDADVSSHGVDTSG